MNVWYHLSTIFSQRRTLQIAGLLAICVALITTLFLSAPSTYAAPGVNKTISFQGRLLNAQGNPVPDGYYNMQFKIYQDGTGAAAGNPGGTLEWTETHVNDGGNNAVFVKGGYMSVDLGSKTAFGTSVDWNQDTLWLSMNVAGSSALCNTFGTAPCLADGEMLPMKRLTATPYAINSGMVGGKTADDLIHNGTSQQTGNFNISGTGVANTLQGNTSVIAPLFDSTLSGILDIGTVNATDIGIGTSAYAQNIRIGTSDNDVKNVTIGSISSNSATLIQGGGNGVRINTSGGFAVQSNQLGVDSLLVDTNGSTTVTLVNSSNFKVESSTDQTLLSVNNDGTIRAGLSSLLQVDGTAVFNQGINIQGTATYTTPGGYSMNSAIAIQNYNVGAFSSVFAFGLPAGSSDTARGMLIADARTGPHQATIGVLSPNENQIMGLSWNGSNSTGYISNTANSLALQGGGLDLLTATNNGGVANVGIGNNASSGYALDVTGNTNTSGSYAINGVSVLNNNGLNFSGSTTSTVSAASGQALQLTGDSGVRIGDGTASGQPTTLTLDKASSTPTVTGDAALGSMYYDTTLGKVQCYEADGWGSCSSSPDTYVSLTPQYANSVFHGTGTGTLTAEFCSDTLNINDGSSGQPQYCNTNETYNLYRWTSSLGTPQSRSIYITHQLPANFKRFASGTTSLMAARSTGASIDYQVYKSTASGLVACGSPIAAANIFTWQTLQATGSADPANCSFAAGDSIVFKINLTAQDEELAGVSTIGFAYNND